MDRTLFNRLTAPQPPYRMKRPVARYAVAEGGLEQDEADRRAAAEAEAHRQRQAAEQAKALQEQRDKEWEQFVAPSSEGKTGPSEVVSDARDQERATGEGMPEAPEQNLSLAEAIEQQQAAIAKEVVAAKEAIPPTPPEGATAEEIDEDDRNRREAEFQIETTAAEGAAEILRQAQEGVGRAMARGLEVYPGKGKPLKSIEEEYESTEAALMRAEKAGDEETAAKLRTKLGQYDQAVQKKYAAAESARPNVPEALPPKPEKPKPLEEAPDFSRVASFDELDAMLRAAGTVTNERGVTYTANDLIGRVTDARDIAKKGGPDAAKLIVGSITGTGGLREAVQRLLTQESEYATQITDRRRREASVKKPPLPTEPETPLAAPASPETKPPEPERPPTPPPSPEPAPTSQPGPERMPFIEELGGRQGFSYLEERSARKAASIEDQWAAIAAVLAKWKEGALVRRNAKIKQWEDAGKAASKEGALGMAKSIIWHEAWANYHKWRGRNIYEKWQKWDDRRAMRENARDGFLNQAAAKIDRFLDPLLEEIDQYALERDEQDLVLEKLHEKHKEYTKMLGREASADDRRSITMVLDAMEEQMRSAEERRRELEVRWDNARQLAAREKKRKESLLTYAVQPARASTTPPDYPWLVQRKTRPEGSPKARPGAKQFAKAA